MALFSRPTARAFCIAAFLLFSVSAQASDDDYLKMLEGEAEDLKLDETGQIDNSEQDKNVKEEIAVKDWKWEGDLEGDALPSGLTSEQFASLLQQRFYGTYVFYRKLSSVDKKTVYYHYSKATKADLDTVRQDILSHLKN